ncbi:ABC transporter permease [Kribbella italica]|uniref:Peptide/nickel transport system permease protein/oligopeptide transport system permease protein n=1 Tax=Kribbella italica TaxID=1540520 RepID=A0A7W9J2E1_9ACTN|nr:ABC transporter permease [Kribbella italica]MBB5834397.1 peptide/nickel transport system permease protein/oligopeptide transport system permease protein [Kribbella italica]
MSEVQAVVGAETQDLGDGRTLSNRELLRALLRKPQFVLCSLILLVFFTMAALPRLFTSVDPRLCELAKSRQPRTGGHPFGFDIQGCDYFANVVYGARPSVLVSIVASLGVFLLAGTFGLLAGYFPGFIDGLISRTADVLFAVPGLVLLIVILNSVPNRSIWIIVGVILLIGWPGGMRLMRSTVFSVRNREYVLAARSVGVPPLRILRRHVFPNAMAPLLAMTTLGIGGMVGLEAALTFLGVGLQPPSISWGSQFGVAASYRDTPHLFIWPALFISTMTISFMIIGDSIRDALDPKLMR